MDPYIYMDYPSNIIPSNRRRRPTLASIGNAEFPLDRPLQLQVALHSNCDNFPYYWLIDCYIIMYIVHLYS